MTQDSHTTCNAIELWKDVRQENLFCLVHSETLFVFELPTMVLKDIPACENMPIAIKQEQPHGGAIHVSFKLNQIAQGPTSSTLHRMQNASSLKPLDSHKVQDPLQAHDKNICTVNNRDKQKSSQDWLPDWGKAGSFAECAPQPPNK